MWQEVQILRVDLKKETARVHSKCLLCWLRARQFVIFRHEVCHLLGVNRALKHPYWLFHLLPINGWNLHCCVLEYLLSFSTPPHPLFCFQASPTLFVSKHIKTATWNRLWQILIFCVALSISLLISRILDLQKIWSICRQKMRRDLNHRGS